MSLLHKSIENITLDDLKSLLGDIPVREGLQIDYKRDMIRPEQLCEAVTSFANSQGGDLLIGIDEEEGIPFSILGVSCSDIDKEKLRLLDIFRNNIEPRLAGVEIEFIEVGDNKYVIVIRTKRSWLRPHRVKHNNKFFMRQANGKFDLDIQQLRQMFLESSDFTKKYSTFLEERVVHHIEKFGSSSFILLHFVPISAFERSNVVDLSGIFNKIRTTPIATTVDNRRINFIGVYSDTDDRSCKFQLFRNGIIEHATTRIIYDNAMSGSSLYEKLRQTFHYSFQNYRMLEMREPLYVMLSIYGIEGLTLKDIDSFYADHDIVPYEFDKMIFPEIFIEDLDSVVIPEIIRPIMDSLWNAYGYSRYPHELK
ncbi:helix-turn-helix domain-containing protein [Paenibacillus thailandensis]|uniref:Helix-turn-helix domain-containing protein n=1 Tax=Paenibacillus thailandensis TaxID=393250 RepID=A0ABW5QRK6_9BACL